MAQINKPTDYFNTKLYTGTGATNSITGVGFQPDWVWVKARSGTHGTQNHRLFDAIRGATKELYSDLTDAEATVATGLTSLDSDGFSLSTSAGVNGSSTEYASWNWLASNTTASNTDGSITSTISANTTSGFSIITYTGTGTAGTIGHGLGGTPDFWMTKARSETRAWYGWHTGIDLGKVVNFNSTNSASTDTSLFTSTAPTSTVYNVGTSVGTNNSGITFVTYAFRSIKGFSKFGSYTGNGNADGTFVYTGFKPAMVIMKNSSTATNWHIYDNKRTNNASNPTDDILFANSSSAESTDSSANPIDFLSNGFKCRGTNSASNSSGNTFIYMAFASEPLTGTNNIPCTAR